MKHVRTMVAFALVLCVSSVAAAGHKDDSMFRVRVIDDVPTANNYSWYVSGNAVTNCYGNSCFSSFNAPDGGTAQANGAVLKLLLPDGRVVIAECAMKQDNAANWANAVNSMFNGAVATTMYRDCRTPTPGDSIRAKFKGNNVKLFMREPSIDGRGKRYSETYSISRTLIPADWIPQTPGPTSTPQIPAPASAAVPPGSLPLCKDVMHDVSDYPTCLLSRTSGVILLNK